MKLNEEKDITCNFPEDYPQEDSKGRDLEKSAYKLLKTSNHLVTFFSERNPSDLPWNDLGIDVIINSIRKI